MGHRGLGIDKNAEIPVLVTITPYNAHAPCPIPNSQLKYVLDTRFV